MHNVQKPPRAAGSALSLLRSPRSISYQASSRENMLKSLILIKPNSLATPAGFGESTMSGSARSVSAGEGDRPICSFNVDGHCRHDLAVRLCFDCRRFDVTGTGFHCEQCFVKRHPWTRLAHNFVFILQRPPSPGKAIVVNAIAERTVREAQKLLNKTQFDTVRLGGSMEATRPTLAAAASTCDALLARVAGTMLQLRSSDWQTRQLAARRIVTLWTGMSGRRWWRTASRLLWGIMRDPESGEDFFINLATLRTTWEQPLIFGRVMLFSKFRRVVACMLSMQAAVSAIQRTLRVFFARLKVAKLVVDFWRIIKVRPSDRDNIKQRKVALPRGHPMARYYYYHIESGYKKTRDKPMILFTSVPSKFGEHEDDRLLVNSVTLLQSYARKKMGKRYVIHVLATQWLRVMDPLYGRCFFVNKKTGVSLWDPPLSLILNTKASDIPTAEEYEASLIVLEEKLATCVLQRFMRRVKGVRHCARKLMAVTKWTRVYDQEYNRFYFYNSATGESSWSKPALFRKLAIDPPSPRPEEAEVGNAETWQRRSREGTDVA